jgi:hypothetical protein
MRGIWAVPVLLSAIILCNDIDPISTPQVFYGLRRGRRSRGGGGGGPFTMQAGIPKNDPPPQIAWGEVRSLIAATHLLLRIYMVYYQYRISISKKRNAQCTKGKRKPAVPQ